MLIFKDLLTGDELFSDANEYKEIQDGFFLEAEGKWVEVGDVDVDIGANPSAEEAEEGVESGAKKVVNLQDAFRLQEGPSYSKKELMAYLKTWLQKVLKELPEDKHDEFKAKSAPACKWLAGMAKELQYFTSESMDPESTMVYAYYKEGTSNPTFLYPKYAMKEEKC